MTEAARQALDAVLKLSDSDRAQIARELLKSLGPEAAAQSDDAWLAALDRRAAELKDGTVAGYTWSQLQKQT